VQIDAKTSSPRRQYENLLIRIRILKILYSILSIVGSSLAIYSAVEVATISQKVVKDVHQASHLTENEHLKILLYQLRQKQIQNPKLLTGRHEVVSVHERRPRLNIIEQVRMIAHFLQLHQNVQQLNFVLSLALTINHVDIAA